MLKHRNDMIAMTVGSKPLNMGATRLPQRRILIGRLAIYHCDTPLVIQTLIDKRLGKFACLGDEIRIDSIITCSHRLRHKSVLS